MSRGRAPKGGSSDDAVGITQVSRRKLAINLSARLLCGNDSRGVELRGKRARGRGSTLEEGKNEAGKPPSIAKALIGIQRRGEKEGM